MKEINIWEILKNVPLNTKLWSNLCGTCIITQTHEHPAIATISVKDLVHGMPLDFTSNGKAINLEDAECILWPSKEIRNWSRWEEELQWREIEQWIKDGICEVKAKFNIHEGYIPFEISKHSDYTSKMRIHADIHHFRKKLKKQYIPFTFEDRDVFRGKWVKSKSGFTEGLIEGIYNINNGTFIMKGIHHAGEFICFEQAFEELTFLNGSPFGKLAE